MSKKLYVFGCSYTENFITNDIDNYTKYRLWRGGNFPLTWSEIIAKELDYELINYGKGGIGNESIFKIFCNYSHEIKKGDMVIIQWTYVHRFDWFDIENDVIVNLGAGGKCNVSSITQSTYDEILINRTSKYYYDNVYTYMNLINSFSESLGFDLYFWSAGFNLIYGIESLLNKYKSKILMGETVKYDETTFHKVFENGGLTIDKETVGLINDLHLGESGHRVLSELFLKEIKNK